MSSIQIVLVCVFKLEMDQWDDAPPIFRVFLRKVKERRPENSSFICHRRILSLAVPSGSLCGEVFMSKTWIPGPEV